MSHRNSAATFHDGTAGKRARGRGARRISVAERLASQRQQLSGNKESAAASRRGGRGSRGSRRSAWAQAAIEDAEEHQRQEGRKRQKRSRKRKKDKFNYGKDGFLIVPAEQSPQQQEEAGSEMIASCCNSGSSSGSEGDGNDDGGDDDEEYVAADADCNQRRRPREVYPSSASVPPQGRSKGKKRRRQFVPDPVVSSSPALRIADEVNDEVDMRRQQLVDKEIASREYHEGRAKLKEWRKDRRTRLRQELRRSVATAIKRGKTSSSS